MWSQQSSKQIGSRGIHYCRVTGTVMQRDESSWLHFKPRLGGNEIGCLATESASSHSAGCHEELPLSFRHSSPSESLMNAHASYPDKHPSVLAGFAGTAATTASVMVGMHADVSRVSTKKGKYPSQLLKKCLVCLYGCSDLEHISTPAANIHMPLMEVLEISHMEKKTAL